MRRLLVLNMCIGFAPSSTQHFTGRYSGISSLLFSLVFPSFFSSSASVCLFYHTFSFWSHTVLFFVLVALEKLVERRLWQLCLEMALRMTGLAHSAGEGGRPLQLLGFGLLVALQFGGWGYSLLCGLLDRTRRWIRKESPEFCFVSACCKGFGKDFTAYLIIITVH